MKTSKQVDLMESGGRDFKGGRWISVGTVLAILAAWAAATNLGLIGGRSLPTPQAIVGALWEFITVGYQGKSFLDNVGHSIFRAMAGLTLGVALGVPLGLLTGYHPRLNAMVSPIIGFLRPIPSLAFIPLVILYLGIGEISKVAVIWLAAFLYMTLYASTGVKNVKRDYILLGQNLELSQWDLFRTVIFPASLTYIIAGLKTATALSWAIVVAAELIAAQSGLGYMIMDASTFFNLPFVCVGILFIGGIGLLLELFTNQLEKRVIHWAGH